MKDTYALLTLACVSYRFIWTGRQIPSVERRIIWRLKYDERMSFRDRT